MEPLQMLLFVVGASQINVAVAISSTSIACFSVAFFGVMLELLLLPIS
jgi:hypothetical protein